MAVLLGCVLLTPVAAAAGPLPQAARFVHLSLDSVTQKPPAVPGEPATVTVTGSLHNTGDRRVKDLVVRLQRADAAATSSQLRSALAAEPSTFDTSTPFVPVADSLAAGARTTFEISVPITTTGDKRGLDIPHPGVYPLLVNLNGTPDYGSPARLDDSRTLMSVRSVPATADTVADELTTAVTSSPTSTSIVWPLAAPPQLAPGIPGGGAEPVRLISDDLATSVRPGGRLNGLLTSIDAATTDSSANISRSACLAIDPDLLVTLQAMSSGYVVTNDPTDPTAATHSGSGQQAAADYLQRLRAVAARLCVVALPFAQAGLDTLAAAADPALTRVGIETPSDLVDATLGVKSLRNVVIPNSGGLTRRAATMISRASTERTVVAASAIAASATDPAGHYQVGSLHAVTYDPALTSALAAMGTAPSTPALTPMNQRFDIDRESALARRNDAIGALDFAALAPTTDTIAATNGTPAPPPITGRSQIVMPPAVWSATRTDADAVLSAVDSQMKAQLSQPASLASALDESMRESAPATLRSPPGSTIGASTLTARQVSRLSDTANELFTVEASLVDRGDTALTPRAYIAPMVEDVVRAMRDGDITDAHTRRVVSASASNRQDAVDATLARIRNGVRIFDPGGRYTLASERSPLLLVLRNDVPLAVRVRLDVNAPANLDIGDVGVVEIPPRGTRQIQLPTHATSSASMTVSIGLISYSGITVGKPIQLSVHSNAYGKPLFVITICAAVLLVLLAGRRLWHRFRGKPDPADLDRPGPDDRARLRADSRYLHSAHALDDANPLIEPTSKALTAAQSGIGDSPDDNPPPTPASEKPT